MMLYDSPVLALSKEMARYAHTSIAAVFKRPAEWTEECVSVASIRLSPRSCS